MCVYETLHSCGRRMGIFSVVMGVVDVIVDERHQENRPAASGNTDRMDANSAVKW